MAVIVQHRLHSMSRAIAMRAAASASARERKPRHSFSIAAKNLTKLALRLLPVCLLALLLCACVAELLSVISPQVLSGNGVYLTLTEGNSAGTVAEGIGAGSKVASSWEGSAIVGVPQCPSAPPIGASFEADISKISLKSGTALGNYTVKTDVKKILGTDGHARSYPPPKNNGSPRQSAKPIRDIEVRKTKSKITCDDKSKDEGFPYARPIVCEISGDVRVSPASSSVTLATPPWQQGEEVRRVRPYARQDDSLLPLVREVVVRAAASESGAVPRCGVSHGDVPAVIFSVGGYTGNFFHEMADVLVPLYLTSFHFKGRVRFLVADYKKWWVQKYRPVLRRLSRYEIVDFDADKDVHCFRRVILGLVRDRDLILRRHPTRNPRGHAMVDFTRFLRRSYGLRRHKVAILGEEEARKKKPRMLIISRRGTRKLLNLKEVEAMARGLGFEVVVSEAGGGGGGGGVKRFAAAVNGADVLVGVHGAGLANAVFLPARAVVVQVVPWGRMEWMAANFYGSPARGMGLRHVEYHVAAEESSLAERFPREHAVFRDPMAIHGQGWKALAGTVMAQDVRLDLARFRPTLLHALDLLQE